MSLILIANNREQIFYTIYHLYTSFYDYMTHNISHYDLTAMICLASARNALSKIC